MTRFKIAIITKQVSTNSGSRVAIELTKGLTALGNSVTIYASEAKKDSLINQLLKKPKISLFLFPDHGLMAKFIPNWQLAKSLKKQNPDFVIFCSTLPYFLAAKLAKVKMVRIYMGTQFNAYLENSLPSQRNNILDHLLNTVANVYIFVNELIMIKLSSRIIAISNFAKVEATRLYGRKPDQVIYLGGDHLKHIPTKKASKSKNLNLLSVSRITPYKGFHSLIEIVNNNPGINLTITGPVFKKNYYSYLKKIAGKNIHFEKNVTDSKLASLYSKSDLYVTADKYLFFGFPPIEAAFYKKPSIIFDFAASREIVLNKKTGFVVKNPEEFINLVRYLSKNRTKLNYLGSSACKIAHKNFTWQKIILEYQSFFEKQFTNDK